MKASERGQKHICPECATRYYDLKKKVVACPRCGAEPSLPKLPRATQAPKSTSRLTFGRFSN